MLHLILLISQRLPEALLNGWIGDGFCDDPWDGISLNCAAFSYDGGDCGCTDCDGATCDGFQGWVGDGYVVPVWQ